MKGPRCVSICSLKYTRHRTIPRKVFDEAESTAHTLHDRCASSLFSKLGYQLPYGSKPCSLMLQSVKANRNHDFGPVDAHPNLTVLQGREIHEKSVLLSMALTFGELAKNSFCDFFHVPDDYPDRIKTYPNAKIKQQEAVKTRKVYAALVSIVNGAAFVVPSHGGSLVICAWAARRLFVATHKLKFIKAELTIRKLELRRFMHRDWMIPVAVALASIAISCGVDFGLHHFVPIGHPFLMTGDNGSLSAAVVTPSGATATSTVHSVVNEGFTTGPQAPVVSNMMGYIPTSEVQQSLAVIQHPITAAADVGKGFLSEWQHIFGHGQENVVDLMSGDSGSQGLAAATGFVSGEHVAGIHPKIHGSFDRFAVFTVDELQARL